MNIHVVQPGETIQSIADLYGVSEAKLLQDNELVNPNNLVPGQTIVIVYPEQTYTVQPGDTLEDIAENHNVTIMQLLRNNPFLSNRDYINPGETLVISYGTDKVMYTMGYSYPFISKDTLKKTLPSLTYLSIFNYRATSEGKIISYYDETDIVQTAKEYSTVPLVLMTTLSEYGQPDLELAYNLLLNEEYQNTQLENLLDILRERGYLGVNFVFYFMNDANQTLYQNFIKKASDRLMKEGYYVFTTINPNIKNIDDDVVFDKLDYSEISNAVNGITFLQFIWGSAYGPPAPVSSIYNLRTFIDYAASIVPPDKIIVGKPIIAYDWTLPYSPNNQRAVSLTLDSAITLAQDFGVTIQFDEVSQTPFFEYIQSNIGFPINHIVWFVDARSINALVNLIAEYNILSTGIWNIMIYSPQLWLIINSQYEVIKILPIK